MNSCPPDAACRCDFEVMHGYHAHPALRAIEREVLGCDYGGTSWTTTEQARWMSDALGLGPGIHLLELGAGSGWPSLFQSRETGCGLTLLDVPAGVLREASRRAREEAIPGLNGAVSASAESMPVTTGSFSRIAHSDVLCCLPGKAEMLAECRRVAGVGAVMVFFVIAPAEGLDEEARQLAGQIGPPFVGLDGDYPSMLRQTGWDVRQRRDVTAQYLATMRVFLAALIRDEKPLRELMEGDDYDQQIANRRRQRDAIDAGLLVREAYICDARG